MDFIDEPARRYHRQIILPNIGEEGQRRLGNSSVLVVGAGGLGSPCLSYLTAAGVGRIGVADGDRVSLSNLQRQILYTTADIGLGKAQVACRRLKALNPNVTLTPFDGYLTPQNALQTARGFDLIIDATDNYAARLLIDRTSRRLGIPFLYASVEGFTFQCTLLNAPGAPSYEELFGTPPQEEGSPVGVLGAVAGMAGSLQAVQAVQVLLGHPDTLAGKLLTADLSTCSFTLYTLPGARP